MTSRTKTGLLSAFITISFVSLTYAQVPAFNQNEARSNHSKSNNNSGDAWNFGINTGTSFGLNSNENTLFRGNSLATKMFGGYYLGKFGLGMSGGFIPGKLSEGAINNFIAERNFQQSPVSSSDPFNGYLMFGPTAKFGERIKVLAELQGGMFLNNPGSMTIGQAGAVRPLYRYEAGDKSLFPGFSGNINIAYPLNASTTFFINSEYLQTKSSIVIYDPKNGIDVPTEQTRDVKLMNFGIGISKSFGRRDQASGMASGKSNAQYNPKEYSVKKTYQPGQPVYGNRTTNESCGPVTIKTTAADGTTEEMTFACPDDAANYIVNSHSTPGVDVSARTYAVPHVFEQKVLVHHDIAARNVLTGKVTRTSSGTGFGIVTNKTIRGGGIRFTENQATTRTTPNSSFGTMVRLASREAGSGMATGKKQYELVFDEQEGIVCNPCNTEVKLMAHELTHVVQQRTGGTMQNAQSNPLYQDKNMQGTNPFYENNSKVSNPDWADLSSGIIDLKVSLIEAATGTVVATTNTEPNGDFFFGNVPDGAYVVRLSGMYLSKKGYDIYLKSKAELEGDVVWSGENLNLVLFDNDETSEPSMRAGISTSRSNIRCKSITVIDADTDGDGSFDSFRVTAGFTDGTTKDITEDASASRVNKIDAFTIKQKALQTSNSFASKLGNVTKGAALTGITVASGDVNSDGFLNGKKITATYSDGSSWDITADAQISSSGNNLRQFTIMVADLDDDGMADAVVKIGKSRSNIQNNRMLTGTGEDNGNAMEGVKIGKSRSNIQNNRIVKGNDEEDQELGVVKTKTKSNQSNDRMMSDDEGNGIWSPRSNITMYAIAVGDLDGDGKPEAIINTSRSNIKNQRVIMADVDGDGVPEAAINTSHSNIKNLRVAAGDVDGDGITDLVSGNKLLGGALPGGSVISAALMPGDPIPGIDVKLKRKSATFEKKIDSDINGRYHIIGPDMEPDTYTMMVTTNIYIDDETLVVLGNKDEMATNEEGGKKATSGIKQTMQTQVMVEAPVKWTAPEPVRTAINNSHSNIKNLIATVSDIEQMLNNDNSGANASAINNSHSNIKNLRAAAMDMNNALNNLETMEKDAAMNTVKNNMAAMNMQFLALQESLQKAGRQYTTISNVLKTKHDTVKNSIGNIR